MRIVHLNYDALEKGGASIAMIRIHRALRAQGVDSIIACVAHAETEHSVLLKRPVVNRVVQVLAKCVMRVLFRGCHSTGFVPSGIVSQINALKPDVVVLHWLQQDTVSMRELTRIQAPMLWMHHDLWPTKGIKAHDLLPYWWRWYWPWARLTDSLVRWNKRRVFAKLRGRLTPVAASAWTCSEIVRSGAFGDTKPMQIALPLPESFLTACRALSETPRVRTTKFTVLNGSRDGFSGGLKGGDRLLAALRLLTSEARAQMRLQIVGRADQQVEDCGIEVEYLGWRPADELPRTYRGADVFAFPSRQETFGQTKIESLACGTPVLAFDETACAEGLDHLRTGYIAKPDDIADFAAGLRYYFAAWQKGGESRLTDAISSYTSVAVARAWIVACEKVVKGRAK